MPEYVYALHDFLPEHDDEISFKAGERIEVIERDDLYGDGWWQGKNLAGKQGLFPKSYITPTFDSPSASQSQTSLVGRSTLHSLPEEDGETSEVGINKALNGSTAATTTESAAGTATVPTITENGVMRATMTDVQKAIEQLGHDGDDARSFSFASIHTGEDATDNEMTDREGDGDGDGDGEEWHRDARQRLAENARRVQEERDRLKEAEDAMLGVTPESRVAPPIEVELSDESEGEEDDDPRARLMKDAEEEDEHDAFATDHRAPSTPGFSRLENRFHDEQDEGLLIPPVASESAPTTATRVTFPAASASPDNAPATTTTTTTVTPAPDTPPQGRPSLDRPSTIPASLIPGNNTTASPSLAASIALPKSPSPAQLLFERESNNGSPFLNPSGSSNPNLRAFAGRHQRHTSGGSLPTPVSPASILTSALTDDGPASPVSSFTPAGSTGSASGVPPSAAPAALAANAAANGIYSPSPQKADLTALLGQQPAQSLNNTTPTPTPIAAPPATLPSPAPSSSAAGSGGGGGIAGRRAQQNASATPPKSVGTHPSEWTVEEVVEWLKGRGFDQGVCDKFIEQEITGDVLLDLDVNLLKTELGIMAFGKRMRIANAITELRRPPSVNFPDNPSPLGGGNANGNGNGNLSQPGSAHMSMSSQGTGPSQVVFMSQYQQQQQQQHPSSLRPGSSGTGAMTVGMPLMSATSIMSPESPPPTADTNNSVSSYWPNNRGRRDSDPGSAVPTMTDAEAAKAMVGLGIVADERALNSGGKLKGRPAQLALSPSDNSLKKSGIINEVIDERAVMSESEMAPTPSSTDPKASRRHFLGRSTGSNSSHDTSRDGSTLATSLQPNSPAPARRSDDGASNKHARGKKSVDGGKSSDARLSFFGGSLSGTIGKSRKPAPRVTSQYVSDDQSEVRKDRTLSRLYHMGGSSKKNSPTISADQNKRPTTPAESTSPPPPLSAQPQRDPALLRKRTSSSTNADPRAAVSTLKPGQSILEQIGTPDHSGWMRKKGDRYNAWKLRYFVLKGPHLYILRSNAKTEMKIKGYINIQGYKVIADEDVAPGKYGFRIVHDTDPPHFFSSDEQYVVRDWMKSFMKATIGRDYSKPVISSCNIPTIPLTVAQAMNPAPRPPSPSQRAATQKAMRRENPNQLSTRDARVLMGLPSPDQVGQSNDTRQRLDSFFSQSSAAPSVEMQQEQTPPPVTPPFRPSRDSRRLTRQDSMASTVTAVVDDGLLDWANSHLPKHLQIADPNGPLFEGLALLRLAESIKGRALDPPVLDSAFPTSPSDDKLDGLFRLFDFLLDNDVKMGSVSINDVRNGNRVKVVQLLKALKAWEDKRYDIAHSIGKSSVNAGPWMAVDSRY